MNNAIVVGIYGNCDISFVDTETNVVKIEHLKQFVKAGWLNNLDVLIVNSEQMNSELTIILDQALDKIDICAVTLGPCKDFSNASYVLTYDDEKKEISNEIITNLIKTLSQYKEKIHQPENETEQLMEAEVYDIINSLVEFIDTKDGYTKNHCERVARYAYLLAKEIGMTSIEKNKVYLAGLIHDIGKAGIVDDVLQKKNYLTEKEYGLLQKHAEVGDSMLPSRFFSKIKPIIRGHHERYDGRGYPDNLKGNEIPLEARILAIADSFDAMTTKRGYNDPKSLEEAIVELEKHSGKQFDPDLTTKFIESIKHLNLDCEKETESIKKAM